jgi:four helix bundle protein
MRDHRNFMAFELAVLIYKEPKEFPREEVYGLTSKMRRASVSVASNIVECCAQFSKPDYIRFRITAYGSAQEIDYPIGLAHRFGFLSVSQYSSLHNLSIESVTVLNGLIRSFQD